MTDEQQVEVYRPMDKEQVALLKQTVCRGASDTELALFIEVCERTGLNPFARQIYAIRRWDSGLKKEVMGTQVSIDGARLTAQRSGRYAGQTPVYWCGQDKVWTDVWLDDQPPAAAKVGVYMTGAPEPIWGVATWKQYVPLNKEGNPTAMWLKMGPLMLGKCAEMLALRKGFPQELSGLYAQEEMDQADNPPPKADPPVMVSRPSPLAVAQEAPSPRVVENDPDADPSVVSRKQLALIAVLMNECGIPEEPRDDRLQYVGAVIGRPIHSSKELTKQEASHLIDALQAEKEGYFDDDPFQQPDSLVDPQTGELYTPAG